jgi:protein involved in sex pheromone biosynthesis
MYALAACGNHKDDQAGKDNQKHNNSSNQVKEIATDKNVQGDNPQAASIKIAVINNTNVRFIDIPL